MQDSWRITGQPDVIHEKYSSGINRKCRVSSLRISRVIEQDGQLDDAMPKLREVRRVAITWIQVRGGIVRRKQDQRVEEFLHRLTSCCGHRDHTGRLNPRPTADA